MSLPFLSLSPDDCLGKRSKVRGQIAEVTPDLNLVPCLLHIFVWFVAALCGSGFSPLNSDLEPPTLFPCSDRFQLQAGVGGQFGGFVGCFPGEISIAAAEVSVCGGLAVNRTSQIERI